MKPGGTFECYLTYACDQRCAFCFVPGSDRRRGAIPFPGLSREMMLMRKRGLDELSLLGGEPTLHPDIERITALGRRLGYRRILTFSNGRRFADAAFTARMKAAGLTGSNISLHGHTAALHDGVTGVKGSFDKAVAGVRNLVALGLYASLICVVQKKNHRWLREYASFFWKLGVRDFSLFFLKYQGRLADGSSRAASYMLDAGSAARSVKRMFGFFREKAAVPPVLEHFPPCCLPGYESRMPDYYPGGERGSDGAGACVHPGEGPDSTVERSFRGRTFMAECRDCVYRSGCSGIDEGYLDMFGSRGLGAVRKQPRPFYSRWGRAARLAAMVRTGVPGPSRRRRRPR